MQPSMTARGKMTMNMPDEIMERFGNSPNSRGKVFLRPQ
jgi:hypothetical protein